MLKQLIPPDAKAVKVRLPFTIDIRFQLPVPAQTSYIDSAVRIQGRSPMAFQPSNALLPMFRRHRIQVRITGLETTHVSAQVATTDIPPRYQSPHAV